MPKKRTSIKRKRSTPPIVNLIKHLQENLEGLLEDAEKFDRYNNTAGVRVRIGLQEIAYKIKSVRQEILVRKHVREEKRKGEKK